MTELPSVKPGWAADDEADAAAWTLQGSLPGSGKPNIARQLQIRMLEATRRLNPGDVVRVLDAAASRMSLDRCVDEVLLPVMHQVGLLWVAGLCTPEQERMTTEAVRAWLDGRSALAPPPHHLDAMLLACGPRDQHTIGLEALALLLRFDGWPCRVLGARTSVFDLLIATQATDPAAVIVVSHLSTARPHAVTAINEICRRGYRVLYAGNAFVDPNSRTEVSGDYLGATMRAACLRLAAASPG
jgi:methanogenic corrinoid protein MtbC1